MYVEEMDGVLLTGRSGEGWGLNYERRSGSDLQRWIGWIDKLFDWKKVFFGHQITQEAAARNFIMYVEEMDGVLLTGISGEGWGLNYERRSGRDLQRWVGWIDKLFDWKKVFFGRQITQEAVARNIYL